MQNSELITKGQEFAAKADTASTAGMALVYLKKARNYFTDGGREDLAELIDGMLQRS